MNRLISVTLTALWLAYSMIMLVLSASAWIWLPETPGWWLSWSLTVATWTLLLWLSLAAFRWVWARCQQPVRRFQSKRATETAGPTA